jgi:hypothetical protein
VAGLEVRRGEIIPREYRIISSDSHEDVKCRIICGNARAPYGL